MNNKGVWFWFISLCIQWCLSNKNALVAGNGSYIVRPCGHDLHGPTNLIHKFHCICIQPGSRGPISHWLSHLIHFLTASLVPPWKLILRPFLLGGTNGWANEIMLG